VLARTIIEQNAEICCAQEKSKEKDLNGRGGGILDTNELKARLACFWARQHVCDVCAKESVEMHA